MSYCEKSASGEKSVLFLKKKFAKYLQVKKNGVPLHTSNENGCSKVSSLQKMSLANDSVAQLVEQQTLNLWVQGSIPCWVTKHKH